MWRAWMLVVLVGCSSGPPPMKVTVEIIDPPFDPNCMATISWVPPTERVDDAPFTLEEIERYYLFIGLETGVWYRIVGIEDGYLTQWEEDYLLGGDNYFSMTVTDTGGLESDHADEVIKFVDNRCN